MLRWINLYLFLFPSHLRRFCSSFCAETSSKTVIRRRKYRYVAQPRISSLSSNFNHYSPPSNIRRFIRVFGEEICASVSNSRSSSHKKSLCGQILTVEELLSRNIGNVIFFSLRSISGHQFSCKIDDFSGPTSAKTDMRVYATIWRSSVPNFKSNRVDLLSGTRFHGSGHRFSWFQNSNLT